MLSMARVWEEAFWKPAAASPTQARLSAAIVAPIAWLVCLTLGITVAAGPVYGLSMRAATQLLDPKGYVRAVLEAEGAHAAR
jgi:multicomponent Na+:H+ antiporter subunit D